MRPRVFPAEDMRARTTNRSASAGFNEAAGIPRGRRARAGPARGARGASMRPRVFPAEDSMSGSRPRRHSTRFNEARVFPAEDFGIFRMTQCGFVQASMRPRVFPAEDVAPGGRHREVGTDALQ